MGITAQTDYALRILMYLAEKEERATIDEISGSYGISRNHVMKIVQRLASLGYLLNARGRGGGLSLARPANMINLGGVIRDMENLGHFVECFDPATNSCRATKSCDLKHILGAALEQFFKHLDKYHISDLVGDRLKFAALFPA